MNEWSKFFFGERNVSFYFLNWLLHLRYLLWHHKSKFDWRLDGNISKGEGLLITWFWIGQILSAGVSLDVLSLWLAPVLSMWLAPVLSVWLVPVFSLWLAPVLSVWLAPVLNLWLALVLGVWLVLVLGVWLAPVLSVWLTSVLSVWLAPVFCVFEHQDGVVNLEGGAKFDWHDPDDVPLGEQEEGPAIDLLDRQRQEPIRSQLC